jgi:7-cyano-7-deazaguanine synthase in queuosine biosynthesis
MNVRHILGISGGKDSAALAIYLKQKFPTLKIEYRHAYPREQSTIQLQEVPVRFPER